MAENMVLMEIRGKLMRIPESKVEAVQSYLAANGQRNEPQKPQEAGS